MRGMLCPHRQAVTFLLLGVGLQVWAADAGNSSSSTEPPSGRLIPGCPDNRVPRSIKPSERDRYCRWVVRFRRSDRSSEQIAVESALDGVTAVQPAQIQGDRASVLAETQSGEFTVVYLEKKDGVWTTVGVLNPSPPAKPHRQR
jgi:hypothetical protein